MHASAKTKQALLAENLALKQRIKQLEQSESEHKRSDEVFPSSGDHYLTIIEDLSDVIYSTDAEGKVIFISPSIEQMIGYKPGEVEGKNIFDFVHKEDLPTIQRRVTDLSKNILKPEEYRIITSTGTPHWVMSYSKPLFQDGKFQGIQGVITDIHPRKVTEEALRESETKLQAIFNAVGTGILIIDKDTQIIIEANQAAIEMTGLPKERIIGQICHSLVCPAQAGKCPVKDLGQRIDNSERKLLHPDGYLKDILKTVYPIVIEGRDCYLESFIDITERKQVEDALRDSESKYQFLAESMADVVFMLDMNLVTTYVSPSIERMLGFTPEERIAQRVDQQLTPKSQKLVFEALVAELDREKEKGVDPDRSRTLELEYYHKDGSTKYLVTYIRGMRDSNGNLTGIYGSHHDITERKRAEDMLRLITDNMSDMIRVTDFLGLNLYSSPSHFKNLGYRPEERVGKSAFDIVHPDDLERIKSLFLEAISGNRPANIEYRVKHAEGHYIWLETVGDFFRNDQGEATAVIMSSRNITERNRAEHALRESEERYRTILNEMEEGYQEVDLAGNFTYFNEAFLKLFGFSRDEMMGTNFSRFAAEEAIAKKVHRAYNEMYKTGLPIKSYEWDIIRKDGARRTLEFYASVLRDSTGGPTGFRGIVRDITDRRRAEELLRVSEERYRILVKNATDIVFRTDNSGHFTFVNPAGIRITGYEEQELIGQHYPTLICADMRDEVIKFFSRQFVKGIQNTYLEYTLLTKEGHQLWFGQNTQLIFEDDHVVGFQAVARDITARKRAEEELLRTLDSLRKSFGAIIQVMVSAVEARDPYTAGHQVRSADLARFIATEMGLPQEKIDGIRMAGSIHDVGKLSVPAEILSKPTKLTNIEFSMIKEHSQKGYDILKDVESPWPLAQIVYQHHERMDGSGYPRNLKGDEILMEARILAVADVVEAMASHRPYRPAIGINAALVEIENNKGTLYDADVVDACLRLFREKDFNLRGHDFKG